jgi:hypothetical protein
MEGGNDPANRGGFPWDAARWDHDVRDHLRAVLAMRAAQPALRHGATLTIGSAGPAMAIERRLDADRLIVAVNPGDDTVEVDATVDGVDRGRLESIRLPGDDDQDGGPVDVSGGHAIIRMSPRTGRVLRVAGAEA